MGMTETQDVGFGFFHDVYQAFVCAVFKEVFVDASRTPMHEQQIEPGMIFTERQPDLTG